jgi:ATPase subunit of ABC transporter with duplicated ATPase domains
MRAARLEGAPAPRRSVLRISLDGVSKHYGAITVLDRVTLSVTPERRLGVVGPNGVGKSTLLRLIAGIDVPDQGTITRAPAALTSGYLPQEHDRTTGETLLAHLARRTGVAAAQQELEAAAAALAAGEAADDRYAVALDRFVALGGGDLDARAGQAAAELGLPVSLDRELESLSGGEAARVALAAILLSRFDVLLLDEPTNDLDFDGLERLERFVANRDGGLVVVSHDREFLDRTVTRIVEIEPWTRRVREWAGGFSEYEAARDAAREAAYERFEHAEERRREIEALLARRRQEALGGFALGEKTGGADRRGTNALRSKVRLAERSLERADRPEKPFEPWELELRLETGERANDRVAALDGATAVRGEFSLGPVNLLLGRGERVLVTGRNGSGKSTLLGMLLGELPLVAGSRFVGRRTVIGTLEQGRGAYDGEEALLGRFRGRAGLRAEEARTLLAKFGLGADHVGRACSSLSPGERTRAHLAELQARRVNLLVLDEPTNHLDLEAVEQLESALQGYDGTVVLVTHDRRFIDRFGATRTIAL